MAVAVELMKIKTSPEAVTLRMAHLPAAAEAAEAMRVALLKVAAWVPL